MSDVIPVAIIDGHPVIRRGLMSILASVPDIEVVTAVAAPTDLLHYEPGSLGVVIYDPHPFGETGSLESIGGDLCRLGSVLVVSAFAKASAVMAALQAGAKGYMTKDANPSEYVRAIRAVSAGRTYVSPPAPAPGIEDRQNSGWPTSRLSEREQEVLVYIGRGFTHQQTATHMGVSKATVDTYVGRVRTKLGVSNKAQLALAAARYLGAMHRDDG